MDRHVRQSTARWAVQQPSAIATAPLDEPDSYRDGGHHGDNEQDLGCHRTNLSASKLVIGRVPHSTRRYAASHASQGSTAAAGRHQPHHVLRTSQRRRTVAHQDLPQLVRPLRRTRRFPHEKAVPVERKLPGEPIHANAIFAGRTTDASKRPGRVNSWVASLSRSG
jgi:hypothetical protein